MESARKRSDGGFGITLIMDKYSLGYGRSVHKEIKQAVDDLQGLSLAKQAKIKEILKGYANGEIGIDEAYYDLLDNDLIPMPQRCGMHAKIQEDEGELREYIKVRLFG